MKIKKINLLIIIILFLSLIYAASLLYQIGNIRDEYNISGNTITLTLSELFLTIGLPILFIIINIVYVLIKNNNILIKIIIITLSMCIIIISGLYVLKEHKEIEEFIQTNSLQELTLDSFINFYDNKETGIVYIKRDDCQRCIDLDTYIYDGLEKTGTRIFYYSTSYDRVNNYEKMYCFLDEINVTYVPIVLNFVNGDIIETYSYNDKENIINLFSNYTK